MAFNVGLDCADNVLYCCMSEWKTAEVSTVNVNEANDNDQSGHMWPLMKI